MKTLALCVALATALASTPSFGGYQPLRIGGNVLGDRCQQSSAYCEGYLDGFLGGTASPSNNFCPANGVTRSQMVDAVRDYATSHPGTRMEAASDVVAAALKWAYPCNSGRNQ